MDIAIFRSTPRGAHIPMPSQWIVDIYTYADYRQILRDYVTWSQKSDPKFTFRSLGKKIGIKSSNFLHLIMKSERNISQAMAVKLASTMGFNRDEANYFKHLVGMNQAENADERILHLEQILKVKGYKKAHPLVQEKFAYYKNWYFVAIREMVNLKDFQEDAHWIQNFLKWPVEESEIKDAISALLELDLLERGPDGRLKQKHGYLRTPDEVSNAFVREFHEAMINKGISSMDTVAREERDITALTFNTSTEMIAEAKTFLQKIRSEVVALLESAPANKQNAVYQLNIQLFPLASLAKSGDGDDKK